MNLPHQHNSPVLKLKQIWNTPILLNPWFMILKLVFSLINITILGQIYPQLIFTCHLYLTMLSMYPLYSTHKLAICPPNFTVSMIINLTLAKWMQSLNHFGNIKPNFWKRLFSALNLMLYQQSCQNHKMLWFYLMLKIHHRCFLLNGKLS